MELDNLSKRFWKTLDLIGKLLEHEQLTLCTLLTTVDHSNPKSGTTYKTTQFYDVKCFNNIVEDKELDVNNLFQETFNKLKSELDYQPILEEACKRVFLKYNPYPSQCNLDYFYDNQHRVEKINVKVGDVVHAIVVCGNIVMNDDPNVLEHTKPYVIYLGD